jgi:predicted regulator of amino acid metabolism with ACT domain
MNKRSTRIIIIIIGLAFLVAVAFGIMGRLRVDNQEITDYLESMTPVAQAHIQWLEDYEKLTESYAVLSNSEKVAELNKLLDRMEEIQIEIEESTPPSILNGVKARWNNECVKIVQAVYQMSLALERNLPEWITEAYEFLSQADQLRKEWVEELSNLIDKYSIEVTDFPLESYYKEVTNLS